jgi:hypothetical protein
VLIYACARGGGDRYPDVVAQQQKFWKEREKELRHCITLLKAPESPCPGPVVMPPPAPPEPRAPAVSAAGSLRRVGV